MKQMKIRKIIGILISLTLIHISCLDDITPDKETPYPPAPQGESYFSINIKAGDVVGHTRAADPDASKEDLTIHSVRVVLYDGEESQPSQCKVEYVFEFNMKTSDTWNDPSDPTHWIADPGNHTADAQPGYLIPSGDHLAPVARPGEYQFMTFAQRVKDKSYKMLVILNGRNSDGTLNSEIYKATNKGSYLYQLKQAIATSVDPTNGTITGGKGILMTNHQGLVTVDKSQLTRTVEQAHAAPMHVSVDRLVAKVTLRHADNIILPAGIDENTVTWALDITNKKTYWMREGMSGEQADPTMQTLYARDPNFTVLPSGTDKSNEFHTLFNEYYVSPNQINIPLGQYVYTLENTIDIENNQFTDYEDQITRIIVGYQYTPEGYSKNDSYYIYHNKIINQQEINNYLQDPAYEIPGLDDLRIILAELQQKNYPLNGISTNYYEYNGFRYCPRGQLYYIIPIQHFGGSQSNIGYYGVVRNNIYDITINSLSAPDIAGPYLSADINIQPWALRGQTNTIGISLTERTYAPIKVYYWSIKDNINLYQKKWAEETGKPISQAPEYRTMMFAVGTTVRPFQCVIDWTPEYNYTHSIPDFVTMREGSDSNEMHLFYWYGEFHAGTYPVVTVFFVDKDGYLLDLHYNTTNETPVNPASIIMYPYPEGNNGYVFIKYLSNVYNFYKNGIEYEIRDTNYASYLDQEISSDRITFINQYFPEPVLAASLTGSVWTATQRLVVICEPK